MFPSPQLSIGLGVPVVAQWIRNPIFIHEDAGFIPDLTQWVKNLALLRAGVYVTDVAQIQCYHGCG